MDATVLVLDQFIFDVRHIGVVLLKIVNHVPLTKSHQDVDLLFDVTNPSQMNLNNPP